MPPPRKGGGSDWPFPATVTLVRVRSARGPLEIAPPYVAVLPVSTTLVSVRDVSLKMAPPSPEKILLLCWA
jgi:hypothetical protein